MRKHAPRSSPSKLDSALSWHALYQAALFETDREMIPARIAEAEKAILNRVRELFVVNTDHIEEDQVLDDALYALRALRNCVAPEATAA
jgi:predicted aspartyl protease